MYYLQRCDGFSICVNELLCLHISVACCHCGHYGTSVGPCLCRADGIGAGVHTDCPHTVPHHGPLRREWCWQYTRGHQSARHPPLCAIWDVVSRACAGYGLNPAAAGGLAAFDLFSFKGLKCSHCSTLERHFSLQYPEEQMYKCHWLVTDTELLKLKIK